MGDFNQEWKEAVTVVASDMRQWKAPEKADILVSGQANSTIRGTMGKNIITNQHY
jgi:hypothetical protein